MKEIKTLVIDDEVAEKIKENLEDFKFQDTGLSIEAVDTRQDAIDQINRLKEKKEFYDVVIVDMKMDVSNDSDEQGLEILKLPLSSVKIVFTAFASVDNCIKCLKTGAFDYIDKNSIAYDPYERLKTAIKQGLTGRLKEPGDPFLSWIEQNRAHLEEKYRGKYIAVIDQMVVDAHKNREVLKKRVNDKYPFFKAKIIEIQNTADGDQ